MSTKGPRVEMIMAVLDRLSVIVVARVITSRWCIGPQEGRWRWRVGQYMSWCKARENVVVILDCP